MTELSRAPRTSTDEPQNLPRPTGAADEVTVDTTWGTIQPLQPVPGIPTVGEIEVTELVRGGAQLVDTRVPDSRSGVSLPGAINVPHDQILDRRDELEVGRVNILFCNGPQCPQTPDALRSLAEDAYPLDQLAYYRGGMHDWITLALPTEPV